MDKDITEKRYKNFITLEGGEGSGKTTVAKMLEEYFESKGYKVLLTREPGGNEVAEKIRRIIMENPLHSLSEAYLFAAARIEHINNTILPALKEGKIVICDRYVDSSLVYQAYVGNVEGVRAINKYAYENCMPQKTFFFDITPIEAIQRINQNNREQNRFDKQEIEYHEKIYQGYLSLLEKEDRIIKVDAKNSPQNVFEEIKGYLE